jgi:FAD/FMN-containing dehydrogenase
MSVRAPSWAAGLAGRVQGRVITGADDDYRNVAAVWNGAVAARPDVLVRCESTADVAATVRFATEQGVALAVRGGGHSVAGFSSCEGGIVLDLSPMRSVSVNPDGAVARAQGGCTWGIYDGATAAHGLASTGGLVSTTGVAGLTLGGGIGWLMRKYGLACDNLLSAEVVTAAGTVVRAGDADHRDLLWGLRGGGGNFGVVTEFEYRVHPIGTVVAGLVLFSPERTGEIAAFYRDYVNDLPDEFTTMLVVLTAPAEDFIPDELRGRSAVGIVGCHCGTPPAAEAALAPIRALGPAVDLFDTMSYPDVQTMFDADVPAGDRYWFAGGFLPALTDRAAVIIADHMARRPSPRNEFDLHHMGGTIARVGPTDTAFPDRTSAFTYNIIAAWTDPADDDANRTWARGFGAALDLIAGDRGYVNFLADPHPEPGMRHVYGEQRYTRLVELKQKYDPHNLFRRNHNIAPGTK